MNYFSNRKKWMACLILLTFVFTCIVPTNLAEGNEAWADTTTNAGTDNIKFTLLNYTDINHYVNGAERPIAKYFNFANDGKAVKEHDAVNDEVQFGLNHATVERTLKNGYPVLDYSRNAIGESRNNGLNDKLGTNRNLAYLFGGTSDGAVAKYDVANSLVSLDSDGYYSYNSSKNAVDFNTSTKQFEVKDYTELTDSSNKEAGDYTTRYRDFLPFKDNQVYISERTDTDNRKIKVIDNGNVDYWFGMTMETEFMQPLDGKLNSTDMVFEFTGDDDVWVFIDDVLVLDLGGAHSVVKGSINFSTGEVLQYYAMPNETPTNNQIKNGNTSGPEYSYPTTIKNCFEKAGRIPVGGWDGNVFTDYSTHTIKFFYLERYAGSANCQLKFNLDLYHTGQTVIKEWDDNSNTNKTRPENIKVQLYDMTTNPQKTAVGNPVTLSAADAISGDSNKWSYTWGDLPKYTVEGTEIVYSVEEIGSSNGYTTETVNNVSTDTTIITNTAERKLITVEKVWDNESNPTPVNVQLYDITNPLAPIAVGSAVTLNNTNSWSYTWENVLKFKNNTQDEITYTVKELDSNNNPIENEGMLTVQDDKQYQVIYSTNSDKVTITNSYKEVKVHKEWTDNNNQDGIRPDNITVKLLADGIETGKTLVLSDSNDWRGTFTNLAKYVDGKEIAYTVDEAKVPEGYSKVSILGDTATGFTINNSHDLEKTAVSGYKTWDDNDNAAGKRPEKIMVHLLADGVATTSQAVTYDVNGDWIYSFNDLDKYRDGGTEIVYSVEEEPVTDYQPVYDKNSYNITNVYKPGETPFIQINGSKTWIGDKAEQRPASVTIELLQDGKVTTSQAITADLGWKYDFGTYPKYDGDGKPYTYTVREVNVPAGYVSMVAGFDITNTLHSGEIGQFTVEKDVTGTGTPSADEKFGFRLSLKATEKLWNEKIAAEEKALKDAYDAAVKEQQRIENEVLAGAVNDFMTNAKVYSTGSAYLFAMKEPDASSPSVYQYTTLDKYNRMEVSTSSALSFFNSDDRVDTDSENSVLGVVVETIKGLADEFSGLGSKASVFLQMLKTELGETWNAAVQFEKADADALLQAQNRLFDVQVRVNATSEAVYQFEQKASTPSAVTLIVKNVNTGETETIEMTLDDLSDTDYYRPDGKLLENGKFYLVDGEKYSFIATAADGVTIEYVVVEEEYETENYIGTDVKLNGTKVAFTTPNPSIQGTIGDAETDEIMLVNNYYLPIDPWTPNTTNPETPPPTIPPGTTITDPDVPTGTVEVPGEPLDELNDPEIPLGNAPATGDTNNAVPFVVLMLAAAAGLVLTRRKFN